ncbi:MAG: profilin, required for normal timing of actin polymerization in response to thermal stress [Icmadophila ericetorum]|nr:profilin, required for normal timing of actin polymerization in response to thermal stress [Icmadophila ericetorum]
MSWQAYVDTSLVGTGSVDQAAIFSVSGDSQWAVSKNFSVTADEVKKIVAAFKDNAPIHEKGLHVAGQKYFVIKADERSLYGKQGKEGVVIVKTKQSILVTHYPETVQPGTAAKTVEQLADYLIGVGY